MDKFRLWIYVWGIYLILPGICVVMTYVPMFFSQQFLAENPLQNQKNTSGTAAKNENCIKPILTSSLPRKQFRGIFYTRYLYYSLLYVTIISADKSLLSRDCITYI